MTKWAKIVCCIVAPLGLLFCMVGYAALSTTLTIQGTAQAEMPAVIYIAEISEPTYSSNTTVYSDPICVNFPSTKFTSHIKFGSYSSVRFTVKIVNRTPFTQIFNKLESYNQMEGVEGSFNSANIGARITDLNGTELGPNQGTLTIPSGGSATCIVELSNGSRQVYTRNVLYNFTFVRNTADLTDQAAEKVMDKFEQMLNDQLGEITYTYEDKNGNTVTETIPAKNSFNAMYDEMVIQSNQNRYMGNVGGAPAEDIAIVNALFGEAVIMNVAGQDVPVSVMIKSEDVYASIILRR